MISGNCGVGNTSTDEKLSFLDQVRRERRIRKILVAGSGAVGKTTLVSALRKQQVSSERIGNAGSYRRTLFLDLQTLKVPDGGPSGSIAVLQFVDVAGQLESPIHPIRDATRSTLGLVDVVLLVFASDNAQSLIDLREWIILLESRNSLLPEPVSPDYALVRNKTDLPSAADGRLVEALRTRTRISHYFETSCATGQGIDELREWLFGREPSGGTRGGECTR
jgi:small GTP-binding protein